ncbi:MAG: beta-galactosidase trimerization domain-containing protein [Terricaulis sp.]
MTINRRETLGMATAAFAGVTTSLVATHAFAALGDQQPWHQRLRRIGHINITERDSHEFDVNEYVAFLKEMRAQAALLSLTGVVAFYPTTVPGLRQAIGLNNRDLVGECVTALRAAGIRAIGRMSPDTISLGLADTHPEWFRRPTSNEPLTGRPAPLDSPPAPRNASEALGFAASCQFTAYFPDHIAAVMRECMRRYRLDGIYMNGWPNTNAPVCYCAACRKIGDPNSEAYKQAYLDRAVALWAMFQDLVQVANPQAIYTGNLTGGIEGGDLDHGRLAERAAWFTADNQGRKRTDPVWDAAQQVRMGRAMVGERNVVQVTAASFVNYLTRWRHTSANASEATSRMIQTVAGGGAVWYHNIGFVEGFRLDTRWQKVGTDFLQWQARHDAHFHNLRSLAKVGVVVSPRSIRKHQPPDGSTRLDAVQGVYAMLTQSRIAFDLLHEDYLSEQTLQRYKVLVLPNFAIMSEDQKARIEAFAAAGGSVIATFETGAYDGDGALRPTLALGQLFGVSRTGERQGLSVLGGAAEMTRIYALDDASPISDGFSNTRWISGACWHTPIRVDHARAVLNFVPPMPNYPVESIYSTGVTSDVAAVTINETAGGRHIFFSGDVDAAYWRYGNDDLAVMFERSVRWALGDDSLVEVAGNGWIDLFAYRTEPGYAVHLVNYTNPHLFRGAFRSVIPLGEQAVRMRLEDERPVTGARLLRAERTVPVQQRGRWVEFTVAGVGDYEVAALTV